MGWQQSGKPDPRPPSHVYPWNNVGFQSSQHRGHKYQLQGDVQHLGTVARAAEEPWGAFVPSLHLERGHLWQTKDRSLHLKPSKWLTIKTLPRCPFQIWTARTEDSRENPCFYSLWYYWAFLVPILKHCYDLWKEEKLHFSTTTQKRTKKGNLLFF